MWHLDLCNRLATTHQRHRQTGQDRQRSNSTERKHFWSPVCKTLCPLLSDRCPVCSVLSLCQSVCNVGVLWSNGWIDEVETWHGVDLGPGHSVLDRDPVLPPKMGTAPNFRPMSVVAITSGWNNSHLVRRYRPRPRQRALDGDPAPNWHSPQCSAHACCGQRAG